jgi:hypothetical protein
VLAGTDDDRVRTRQEKDQQTLDIMTAVFGAFLLLGAAVLGFAILASVVRR